MHQHQHFVATSMERIYTSADLKIEAIRASNLVKVRMRCGDYRMFSADEARKVAERLKEASDFLQKPEPAIKEF